MKRAVIDVGSNSVTMTVMSEEAGTWKEIDGLSRVTRLGEGTKATGLLAETNQRETLAAIAECWLRAEALGATPIAVGTMALRIATNTEDFLIAAERQGTPVRVLSGEDEAHYGTQATLGDAAFAGIAHRAIIDVGGHSTELTLLQGDAIAFQRSLPFGTLAIRSSFLEGVEGAVSSDALFRATLELDRIIEAHTADAALPMPKGISEAISMGGGPGMIVAVREALTSWQDDRIHAARLDYEELGRMVGWWMPMSDDERSARIPLQPALGRTIHICALILERMLHALALESTLVSTRGWRHGLLMDDARFWAIAST